jgi:hypothetical protein
MLRPMTDPQITVLFAALAICGTAIALFRQKALGGMPLAVILLSTTGLAAFLITTLTAP